MSNQNADRMVALTDKTMFFCPKCSGTNIGMRMGFDFNIDDQSWVSKWREEQCFDCDDVVQLVKAGIVEPV
jgi:hypothetical protein